MRDKCSRASEALEDEGGKNERLRSPAATTARLHGSRRNMAEVVRPIVGELICKGYGKAALSITSLLNAGSACCRKCFEGLYRLEAKRDPFTVAFSSMSKHLKTSRLRF